ncbi:MAG: ABC transporter substrate-binding protein [Planctomycetes bacterium]|nr:ABC transporter substrate-binding protein [Phycisphaerae bacterium]NBB94363.1 ABC transporter substrate-binding protein [Planctomycetota bacterium]
MRIQLGYTPDADDVYMLHALLDGKVDARGLEFVPAEGNLQTLNDRASRGELEATMISAASYALVRKHYVLGEAGSSFGIGCGPVILAREALSEEALAGKTIAIPGATTTAYAVLQLYMPTLRTRILPFDKLIPAVEAGLVDCALVIHEEFIAYKQYGLRVVTDLSDWWADRSGKLPMPVTCFALSRTLDEDVHKRIVATIADSATYALQHRSEVLVAAMKYSHGAQPLAVDRFVREYVNTHSIEMGDAGRVALETFFEQTARAGILPKALPLDIVGRE